MLLLGRTYHNLNKITVSAVNLAHNHAQLKNLQPETSICPVLKSNAYGHGLRITSPIFDSFGADFLVVDSLYEAYELYKRRVKTRILILGYTDPRNYSVKHLPSHFTVFDMDTAQALNNFQPNCRVHIFVDTGMCREGISLKDLPLLLERMVRLKKIKIIGLASHFSDADNSKSQKFTSQQIQNYKYALRILSDYKIEPEYRHISASSGALKTKDSMFNMIRAGIASYGISPLYKNDPDKKN